MALRPTQPPIQWVLGALSLGVKLPGREDDHSPPSSAEVKEWEELYLHSPSTPSWRGAQLKQRDNFTFNFLHYLWRSLMSLSLVTVIGVILFSCEQTLLMRTLITVHACVFGVYVESDNIPHDLAVFCIQSTTPFVLCNLTVPNLFSARSSSLVHHRNECWVI
jgi:hypothetical protein